MNVEVDIEYRPWFVDLATKRPRFSTIVTHRRAGKTVFGLERLIESALTTTRKAAQYGFLGPTRIQAKAVSWTLLKRLVEQVPEVTISESELSVTFDNGAQIRIWGVDNAENLRGNYFDGIVADEYGLWDADILPTIIMPMLADRQGWLQIQGTPNGKNQFFEAKEHAITSPDWDYLELKYTDTNIIPDQEIDRLKQELDESQFAQEFLASFASSVRGAYYSRQLRDAEVAGRISNVAHTPALRVDTHWDLGIRDSMAIVFTQRSHMEIRCIDYYEASGNSIEHYVKVLEEKSKPEAAGGRGFLYGDHFAPHDIKVRELGTGKSRHEMAQGLGINFHVTKDIPFMDGINNARSMFQRVWFDRTHCSRLLECLHHYHAKYDDKSQTYSEKPARHWANHGSDAFRYMCLNYEIESMQQHQPVRVHRSL